MATRFLERMTGGAAHLATLDAQVADSAAAAIVDADDERVKFYDQTNSRVLTCDAGIARQITPTAAFALTKEQSGSIIMLNAAAGFTITLPAKVAGLRFRFITGAAFATTPFAIVVPAADDNLIYGGAIVNSVFVAADVEGSVNFVESAETIGDFVDFYCDGAKWLVSGVGAGAGSITFTT